MGYKSRPPNTPRANPETLEGHVQPSVIPEKGTVGSQVAGMGCG